MQMFDMYRQGISGNWPPALSIAKNLEPDVLRSPYFAILRTRRVASEYLEDDNRLEYLHGLLCYLVQQLANAEGTQETYALLAAGLALTIALEREKITIDDLGRLTQSAVKALVRRVEDRILLQALYGVSNDVFERIFTHVSQRRRDILFDDLKYAKIPEREVSHARRAVLRQLEFVDASGVQLFDEDGTPSLNEITRAPPAATPSKTPTAKEKRKIAKSKETKKGLRTRSRR